MKKVAALLVLVAIVALGGVAVYAQVNNENVVSVQCIPRPNED